MIYYFVFSDNINSLPTENSKNEWGLERLMESVKLNWNFQGCWGGEGGGGGQKKTLLWEGCEHFSGIRSIININQFINYKEWEQNL